MWRKIRINRTTALDRLKIVSYLTSAKPEGKLAVIAPPKSSVCLNSVAISGFDVENLKSLRRDLAIRILYRRVSEREVRESGLDGSMVVAI